MLLSLVRLGTAHSFAEALTIAVFPRIATEEELEGFPFVQERVLTDGRIQFFCYVNQFNVHMLPKLAIMPNGEQYYQFKPSWHCYDDVAADKEKALATLHPHLFTYKHG